MKRNLTIVAHPDDEILGMGGIIAKNVKEGAKCYALILGTGVLSRNNDNSKLNKLREQGKKASEIIGYEKIYFEDFPDNAFDTISLLKIVKKIEEYIKKIKPDIVYTHHSGDINIDHQKVYESVMTACRPCNQNCPKEIYSFETLSSTEWQLNSNKVFSPNVFIDIESYIDKKLKAMEQYKSELCSFPHSRSLEGIKTLARYRGIQASLKFAEALKLERKIE